MMYQVEVARRRRRQKLELVRTIKQMRDAGMKVNQIARQLGLCRRRIDKWIQLDKLLERSRMQPRLGMPESFRDYLRQQKGAPISFNAVVLLAMHCWAPIIM
jgi:hypothetical protein